MDNGIKLYMKQHGDTVAGKKIEIIRKDVGGVAPDVAKRLAQELIVRDKVDILAGFGLTPNALAVARRLGRGQEADGDHERGDLDHHHQVALHRAHLGDAAAGRPRRFGTWAAKNGIKKVYTMVSDYGPGHDFEGGFQRAFKAAGGEIIGAVRFPVGEPGFLRLHAARQGPQSGIDLRLRSGRRAAGGARQGDSPNAASIRTGSRCSAPARPPTTGAEEHGRRRARHHHRLALRPQPRFAEEQGVRRRPSARCDSVNPDFFSVGGYDGMHLIYEALKKTGGKTDGDS